MLAQVSSLPYTTTMSLFSIQNFSVSVEENTVVHEFNLDVKPGEVHAIMGPCLLYTSPSPRDATLSRMPSSA